MELDQIQYEQENNYDLLTGAQTPIHFYRQMLRLLATRKRNGGALFIITVKVLPPSRKYQNGSAAFKRQISEYEDALILASRLIRKNLRTEDTFTRMAIDGFYILLSGAKDEEPQLVERFKRIFADQSIYLVKSYRLIGDLTATAWLRQVDEEYFVIS